MTLAAAPILLDTDMLSAVMRQDPRAQEQARIYLAFHQRFTFSIITRYEILRGLEAKQAHVQRGAFDRLCAVSTILPLTDSCIQRAAQIYGVLHQRGQLIGDADILIAATCLDQGMVLATNNERHYRRIPALRMINWLAPDPTE